MNCDLILIANASEARLLARTDAQDELVVLDTVLRSESRSMPGPERLAANQSVWEDGGLGEGHAPTRPLDPLRRRMRQFAALVARRFEQELAGRRFDRVALFAACPFLSELMRQLSPATKKMLQAVVDTDISDLGLPQAAQRSEQALQAGEYAARRRDASDQARRLRHFAGGMALEKAAA
ncbi:host attachment protein [Azohydromonas caseinilytica]|uniref:Host attachment protein n=1 Tax=Azohydromonas caseinilytica TaxID=2728836 RepID=A0A848FG43_9BURK|nr:host attachment protein [Azohydromonas caseinilytica]NML17815.1 host attachment protein [Azohydromonas caseinilytica]